MSDAKPTEQKGTQQSFIPCQDTLSCAKMAQDNIMFATKCSPNRFLKNGKYKFLSLEATLSTYYKIVYLKDC